MKKYFILPLFILVIAFGCKDKTSNTNSSGNTTAGTAPPPPITTILFLFLLTVQTIFSSDSAQYQPGDKINISYNPKNPEDVTLADEGEYLLPLFVAGGLGLLMCWGGMRVYIKDKKRKAAPPLN